MRVFLFQKSNIDYLILKKKKEKLLIRIIFDY